MLIEDIFRTEGEAAERESDTKRRTWLVASQEAVHNDPRDESSRVALAHCLRKLNRHGEAIAVLEEGVKLGASSPVHHRYIDLLAECNRTAEAIAAAQAARIAFPHDLRARIRELLLLPVLYDSTAELECFRSRFDAGLERLREETLLDTPDRRRGAVAALGGHTNVYLGYEARNDRDLQIKYGDFAHRIMAAGYPQWSRDLEMPPAPGGQPIRIGYVSARFRNLSATRFFLGWIREQDRARFAIHTWYARPAVDSVTAEVERLSNTFHHFPDDAGEKLLEKLASSIRGSNLHVLVFLDIGLDPLMTQLAALRLAPVQCMAWDQPITSGLPTIDYALSGALAEPEDAEKHYSERLVKLPGVGVCYQRTVVPALLLRKTRKDFHLRADSVVYLCCQSVFKFLPDNDFVFAEIARRVPAAQFVFLMTNDLVGADFQTRLSRAFARLDLRAEDHCVLLPQLKRLDYWNLHKVADVFLDTLGWSSGGSVFDAIACRVPVVTLPEELMRSRQGFAILSQLDATDTIAYDHAGFIQIAVKLGTDRSFHQTVVRRMSQGYPLLYEDKRSVRALEDFFIHQTTRT